ncbi:MAG: aldo/keto reductase [Anaerolineales bacterium]|nr:MAG: aldo/keto reductase [Anaerolineales bacterium]
MEVKKLFTGEEIPVLGLGTWRIGGGMAADYSKDKIMVEIIQQAIRLGYTHIDTAEMYGGGHTEKLLGRALQHFNRQDLFLTTKVWHSNLHYQGVLNAVEGSLKRLHTDYVDMVLIHWPSTSFPLDESLQALNELVDLGKVRYLGVSNFDLELLEQAQKYSSTQLATNQVHYNLYYRKIVRDGVLDFCQKNKILLTAYTPLERGTIINNPQVKQIATSHSATPAQVALAWLIRQPNVITIPMSANITHLQQNLGALGLELNSDDLQQLDGLEMPEEALWPE